MQVAPNHGNVTFASTSSQIVGTDRVGEMHASRLIRKCVHTRAPTYGNDRGNFRLHLDRSSPLCPGQGAAHIPFSSRGERPWEITLTSASRDSISTIISALIFV